MKHFILGLRSILVLAIVLTGFILASTAMADKPSWSGGGKEGKGKQKEMYKGDDGKYDGEHGKSDDKSGHDGEKHRYFKDDHRSYIQNYYEDRYHKGQCPPGLAKKHNGCLPPGQAKKWEIGRPLPREVIFYDLPPRVLEELGPPPPHHRFVRVAQDILLIAVGTGMVIDAIDDLNWEFSH